MLTLWPTLGESSRPQRMLLKLTECHPGTFDVRQQFSDYCHGPEVSQKPRMFGHPGISALEFAGTHQSEAARSRKILSLKAKASTSLRIHVPTHDTVISTATSEQTNLPTVITDTTEMDPPRPDLQEVSSTQRRRGTFVNHTPRDFEISSPKKAEFQPHPNESNSGLHVSPQGCDAGTRSYSEPGQTWSFCPWTEKENLEVAAYTAENLGSKEVIPSQAAKNTPKIPLPHRATLTSSITSRFTGRTSATNSSQDTPSINPPDCHQPGEKQRRRQTPYRITSSRSSNNARHLSLASWVEHNRCEGSSTVDNLPPQVEIDDIAEISTFRAIQEYFDSQTAARAEESMIRRSIIAPNISLLVSPGPLLTSFPLAQSAVNQAEELDFSGELTPNLPPRSLARPQAPTRIVSRTLDTDFASAAEGQYSPYESTRDRLLVPERRGIRGSFSAGQVGRAGSSTLGRIAPTILGHEALTATADLNDLSFYLKNTGPSTDMLTSNSRRKPVFKKIFQVPRKKSLAARVGSVEGSPSKKRPKPLMPACAREMRTTSGARHLRIVIPTDTLSYDHTITLPVSMSGSKLRSRHVSVTWTDEMLNPLASPGLEHAITDFNNMDEDSQVTPRTLVRTRKRSPVSSMPVPVEDHPLKSREEQTRARKLRDLKRIRRRIDGTSTTADEEDTIAGALATPARSQVQMRRSLMESVYEGEEQERPRQKMVGLQHRVILLQNQNMELTKALAGMMGLEIEEDDLEADTVLRTYRQLRFSKA